MNGLCAKAEWGTEGRSGIRVQKGEAGMKRKFLGAVWAGLLALGLSCTAQATLFDRGGGMIYDSDQNLTWLQDANYAMTSGYAAANAENDGGNDDILADGRMGWDAAMAWAAALVYSGYNDWRLPAIVDNANDGCNFGFNGTDCGYNVDISGSEIAYMFHEILGNESWRNTDGTRNSTGCPSISPSCLQSTSADGVNLINLQSSEYWSGTEEYATNTSYTWGFSTIIGNQYYYYKGNEHYAWAVRSGDVGAAPEPGILLLFCVGLAGLGFTQRVGKRRL